jgi:hypothetical protein
VSYNQYQPGPSGEAPGHWAPYDAQKRKRKVWPWVVGALVLLALCGFGALALVGAAGNSVVKQVHATEAAKTADIRLKACNLGEFGMVTVKYTITNNTGATQDYVPTFNIEDKSGNVHGQTADIVTALAPGKTYTGSAVATVDGVSNGNIICKVTGS